MRKRFVVGAVLLVSLLLVPLATGRLAVVSATGVLTGPDADGYYSLTVTNTGDQPIRCFRFFPRSPVLVTGAASLPGWQLGASKPPPAPDIGAQAQGSGLAPGQSLTLRFKTDIPYPANGGGTLRVSADCIADVSFPVTGPGGGGGGGGGKACKCAKLTLAIDGTLLTKQRVPPDRNDFGVGFAWKMTCSAGNGTCKATINFRPPEILAGTLPEPKQNLRLNIKRKTFVCQGPCTKSKTGKFQVKMLSRGQLNELFGRTLAYSITTKCGNQTKTVQIKVSVDQNGRMRVVR